MRPRLVDLAELDDEGHDAPLNWPPAARAVRKGADEPHHVRFTEPIAADEPQPELTSNEPPPQLAAASPFIGTITERTGSSNDTQPRKSKGSAGSRFRAMRAVDKTHGTEKMSEFRRARQERSGRDYAPSTDPSRDPGGGAPPDLVSDMLANVAAENENKIAHMTHADIESELADAMSFFGPDTLNRLQARHKQRNESEPARNDAPTDTPRSGWPVVERLSTETQKPTMDHSAVEDLEKIRSSYFPEEPSAVNPTLEWTIRTNEATRTTRFDFEGGVIARPSDRPCAEPSNETFLAGLHLHGNEQNAPGYSIEELLHLAQSTVASQRTLSLQVIARICRNFPQRLSNGTGRGNLDLALGDSDAYTSIDADAGIPRARILLTAFWLLADRHRSVRNAALSCLANVVVSVSVDSPFSHALRGVCTPFSVDPYLDWKWLVEIRDEPRVAPPAFSSEDASYLELVQRNWAEALVKFGAIDMLNRIAVEEQAGTEPAVEDDLLTLAHALATHSAAAAAAIADCPGLFSLVVKLGGTARAWPLVPESPPEDRALEVILAAVRSSRDVAYALVCASIIDPLLRYIILPPLDTDDTRAHSLFSLTLEIYAALARYGVDNATLRIVNSKIADIGRWSAQAIKSANVRSAIAFFNLLDAWTNAARRDPHHGDLGANWPAVRGWVSYSFSVFAEFIKTPEPSAFEFVTAGTALTHIASWIAAARELEPSALSDEFAANMELVRGTESMQTLMRIIPTLYQKLDASDAQSAIYCYGGMQLVGAWSRMGCAWRTDLERIQNRAAGASMLSALVSPRSTAAGASALRAIILAACVDGASLAVLRALGPEDAQLAVMLLEREATPEWPVLGPFLRENVQGSEFSASQAVYCTSNCTPPTLSVRDALNALGSCDEKNDTITGSALWRSASAGLPIRPDWPFLALDDLLHSGNASVFNGGSLPSTWDFSEIDIVRSTLQLAVRLLDKRMPDVSAANVWLAISKVFLLEDDQSSGRYSGAATGKDLYSDASIEPLIAALVHIAEKLAEYNSGSLEVASVQAGGSHASYYEVYTDLIGLYDSISFGNPYFARVILVATAMKYPRDYRRLLWSDYAHMLKSIRIGNADAPAAPAKGNRILGYLYPLERDGEILGRYAHALASGMVTSAQEFLYTVALHHVSGALWSSIEPESWQDATSVSSLAAIIGNDEARDALLRYVPPGGRAPSHARAAVFQ